MARKDDTGIFWGQQWRKQWQCCFDHQGKKREGCIQEALCCLEECEKKSSVA